MREEGAIVGGRRAVLKEKRLYMALKAREERC